MRFSAKSVVVISAIVAAIAAATVSVAAPSDSDKKSGADERGQRFNGPPREHLSGLAKELGVSTSALQSALEAVREDLGPRKRPGDGQGRPTRADMEKKCNELTDALAKKLGKSGDEVRAAAKAVAKDEIEAAVKARRLTQAQADKILDGLDSAKCLPVIGHHGPGFGCGGERHGFKDGDGRGARHRKGGTQEGSVAPAPPGAPGIEFAPAA